MTAMAWIDTKPVYFLPTGCSTALTTVGRRDGANIQQVSAPQLVRDYNEGMGVADTHDQKRLQRFSIQQAVRVKKYYHTISIGLIDMALVNMYIMYLQLLARKYPGERVPSPCQFMEAMQMTLLAVGPSDFEGDLSIEALFGSVPRSHVLPRSVVPAQHVLEQIDSYRIVRIGDKTQRKRRQYACKVYSILPSSNAIRGPTVIPIMKLSLTASAIGLIFHVFTRRTFGSSLLLKRK
ncbi:unnamed protein product [Phytophthora fragariaefolia]|uniref:Unnamed protein product n=1 Tax=Phytophthora fragariaefolia TaxID=1490495 RepID=A0A9W7CU31_9STRA|nr:unnamed protein product [Phytophthora fragariaefolia]